MDAAHLPALIAELANKSDLVWVTVPGRPAQPLWNVWHDDAIAVVTGGIEQNDPGLADGGTVELILRSKENRARQIVVTATVEQLDPDVRCVGGGRVGASPQAAEPARWREPNPNAGLARARSGCCVRQQRSTEQPGAMSDDSHRAEVVETEATTSHQDAVPRGAGHQEAS